MKKMHYRGLLLAAIAGAHQFKTVAEKDVYCSIHPGDNCILVDRDVYVIKNVVLSDDVGFVCE